MTLCKMMKVICIIGFTAFAVVLFAKSGTAQALDLSKVQCPSDVHCDRKEFQVRDPFPPHKTFQFIVSSSEIMPLRCQMLVEVNAGQEKLPRHTFELWGAQGYILTIGKTMRKITCGKNARIKVENF